MRFFSHFLLSLMGSKILILLGAARFKYRLTRSRTTTAGLAGQRNGVESLLARGKVDIIKYYNIKNGGGWRSGSSAVLEGLGVVRTKDQGGSKPSPLPIRYDTATIQRPALQDHLFRPFQL